MTTGVSLILSAFILSQRTQKVQPHLSGKSLQDRQHVRKAVVQSRAPLCIGHIDNNIADSEAVWVLDLPEERPDALRLFHVAVQFYIAEIDQRFFGGRTLKFLLHEHYHLAVRFSIFFLFILMYKGRTQNKWGPPFGGPHLITIR